MHAARAAARRLGLNVTLMGIVDSWAKKLAAQQAAHRVAGVLDVANDVQVKPPGTGQHSDTEIAQAVRAALEWDVFWLRPGPARWLAARRVRAPR